MKKGRTMGETGTMLGKINAYKILVRKPEWERPAEAPMLMWEDSTKMYKK
jgi:hypothetical protein